MLTELLARIGPAIDAIVLAVAIVFTAVLVNRYAPSRRRHISRVVGLYGIYLVMVGTMALSYTGGRPDVGEMLELPSHLVEAVAIVSLGALALFDVVLPILGIPVVALVSDVTVGVAYVAVSLFVMRQHGMDLTSFVAASTVAAGLLTFSMQSTIANVAGGVALQVEGGFTVGDWVQLENGKQAKIVEIRWRSMLLETREWDTIVVPNAQLLTSQVIILGKRAGQPLQHRSWVYFHVDFRYPPTQVIDAVREALHAAPIERVALAPPPDCICTDLAASSDDSYATYAVRYWLTDLSAEDPTSSAIRARVWSALKRAGIPLARPASTLFITRREQQDDASAIEKRHQQGIAALRSVELFKVLTDGECAELADHLVRAPFTAGETMTRQGAVAHWLYLMCNGTAEVRTVRDGIERVVTRIEAPTFFGEMGLMTGEPRRANVVAITDVECYRLDRNGFDKILRHRPEIAADLSVTLAKRRVELLAARQEIDAGAMRDREKSEQKRIFDRIQAFFGLED